jgi:uncharacterized membrane protein YkoI
MVMNKTLRIVLASVVAALLLLTIGVLFALQRKNVVSDTVIIAAPAGQGNAHADEKVALDALPPAVLDAIKKAFPQSTLTAAELQNQDSDPTYTVDGVVGGRHFNLDITKEGQVVEWKQQIKVEQLPAVVADAVKAAAPDGTITSAEQQHKNQRALYAVQLQTAGKGLKLTLAEDGKVLKRKEAK